MRMTLHKSAVTALWVIGLTLLAGSAHGERIIVDRAKIFVDDSMMTAREVSAYRELKLAQIKAQLQGSELEAKISALDKEVIDELVQRLLLESRARALGIEVSDSELDGRIEAIINRDPRAAQQYSDQQLKSFVLKEILTRRVLQREVFSKVFISKTDIARACRKIAGESREIDVGHILIRGASQASLEQITAIQARLADGESFEALASAVSQDPAVARNKGRLGFISKGQFVKSFEDTAFALPVGKVSGPVETEFGYHLIKVFADRSGGTVDCADMDTITRNRLREKLTAQTRERDLKKYFSKLEKKADIRVLN